MPMEGRELGLASVPPGKQILCLTTQLLWKQLGRTGGHRWKSGHPWDQAQAG